MDKLILGRYIPGNSLIHKLDPRSKLLAMLLFIIIVFWANNVVTNVIVFIFTLVIVGLSQIKFSYFSMVLNRWLVLFYLPPYSRCCLHKAGRLSSRFGFLASLALGYNKQHLFL